MYIFISTRHQGAEGTTGSGGGQCHCNASALLRVVSARIPRGPPGTRGRDGKTGQPGLSVRTLPRDLPNVQIPGVQPAKRGSRMSNYKTT